MEQFSPKLAVYVLALAACALSAACTEGIDATASTSSVIDPRSAPEPHQPACAPVRIAVFGDRTASAETTATAAVSEEQLSRVLAILRRCGGELAYGDIKGRGQSFKPLTRVRIDEPPAKPTRAITDDPFEQSTLDEMHGRQLTAYRSGLEASRAKTEASVRQFLAVVRPRLAEEATANNTDFQSAVDRALLFLDEPQTGWSVPPHQVAMLVTDGQHNTSKWTLDISGDITWLLVNGIGSRGSLPTAGATVFEGVDSAIRFVEESVAAPKP